MAVRRFLKVTASGDLQAMTAAEMDAQKSLAVRAWAINPSVTLARVASGGSLGNLENTYLMQGSQVTSSSAFKNAANTPNVVEVSTNQARINEVTFLQAAPTDTDNFRFPVYADGSNNIRACTLQDMIDTIYEPAIQILLTSSEDYTVVGGTYAVYKLGDNPTNTTQVSASAVYTDSTNTADYSSNDLTATRYNNTAAVLTTGDSWYLYRFDTPPRPGGVVNPAKITTSGEIVEGFTTAQMEAIYTEGMRYTARNVAGSTLSYNINGSGTQKGQSILDTRQTASRYITDQDGDTYRSQEVPDGSVATQHTYRLRLNAT
jgi:hypothetical protein